MRYLEGVVTLELDEKSCNGCGMCAEVCPHGVFELKDRRAVLADRDACMECGACARNCGQRAIRVRAGVGCAAGVMAGLASGSGSDCACSEGSPACC